MQTQYISDDAALEKIAADAGQLILLQLARKVQLRARQLTVKAKGPAPRGKPPHEHFGDLDRSIAIGINASTGEVVTGPRESQIGLRGNVLEFAGTFDPTAGRDAQGRFLRGHAARKAPSGARWSHPFMRPAFEDVTASGSFEPGQVTSSFT
jgi:hypothetical protein